MIDPDVFAVGDICELLTPRHAGQGDPLPGAAAPSGRMPATSELGHAARLRQAQPLAGRGAVRRSCSTFERDYRRLDQAAGRGPRHDRPVRAGVERFRPPERQRPGCCTTPGAGPSRGRPACRSTSCLAENFQLFPPFGWSIAARRRLFGDYGLLGRYRRHPDPQQERFFFGLLRECVEQGVIVTQDMLRERDAAATTSATTPSR